MQKGLPQFKSYHILFLLIGVCFCYTPIKAQFTNLGPTGSSAYTTASGSGSGTGQIHCFGIPPGYNFGAWCPNASNVVFAGSTYGGLWKSTNGGQNWSVVDAVQHLPINSVNDIAFSNNCNYTMYIATGSTNYHWSGVDPNYTCGIYKSVDYGNTFQAVTSFNDVFNFNFKDGKLITKIAVSPFNDSILFVATTDGLFRSKTKGTTWQLVYNESSTLDDPEMPGIWSIEFSPTNSNTVYCSGKEIYKSTDGGTTFNIIPNSTISNSNLVYRNSNLKVVDSAGVDKVVANIFSKYTSASSSQLYSYRTGGVWRLLTQSSSGYYSLYYNAPTSDRLKLDIKPLNDTVIIAGYTETKITSNNGVGWTPATPYGNTQISHGDIHAIKFFPTGDSALIGTDGGVYKYYMNSNTYREQNYGLSISHVFTLSTAPNRKGKLVIGKYDTNADWYDGQKWFQTNVFGDGYSPTLWDRFDDDIFYFNNGASFYKGDASTQTTSQYSSATGCFNIDYNTKLFQNPNPYRKDEIYENTSGTDIVESNNPTHLSNFQILTSLSSYTNTALKGLFISKGFPNTMYTWNYSFNAPWDPPVLLKLNINNFYPTTGCSVPANCAGNCHTVLKPLDPSDYTTNVVASSYNLTTSIPIDRYFPISGVTSCNTQSTTSGDPLKLWTSFDFSMIHVKDVSTFFPLKVYQVRRSLDGGSTWANYSDGLPSNPTLPISHILYIDGSNDAVVCATNNGRIFYRDASMATWQELDANLPHTTIRQLEFNYCQRKLYVGSFGRGVWVYDFSNGTPVLSALQISGNVDWSTKTLDIGADIDILPGATLTINANSYINMGKGTKIIVEGDYGTTGVGNAGKLIIDNATITNSCGENWKGIYVYGNASKPQIAYGSTAPSFQGRCTVSNGAIIENMEKGIVLGHLTDGTKMGGQLYAVNSTFRNNIIAVNQLGYTPPASSTTLPLGYVQNILQSCSLIVNKTLAANPTQLIIQNSKGFQVRANIFENQTTVAAGTARGIAIWGIEAIAEILPLQYFNGTKVDTVKNRISGFNYGVSFGNTVTLGDATHCLKIGNTVFSNNAYGIYIYGVNNATIVLDSITIPQYPKVNLGTMQAPLFVNVPAYGIYLAGCSGYKVQSNTISSSSSTYNCNGCFPQFNTGPAYGIVANNGSSLNETIRKNVLTKCNYGLTAVGLNGSTANGTGLLWQCNDLVQSQNIDIWLAENVVNGVTSTGVLKPQQGDYSGGCITPFSANLFHEQSASVPTYNLQRNSQTQTYLYRYIYSSQSNEPMIPIRYTTTPSTAITIFNCSYVSNYSTICPNQVTNFDWTPATSLVAHNSWFDIRERLEADEQRYLKTLIGTSDASYAELLDSITALPFVKGQVLYAAIVHPSATAQLEKLQALLLKHSGANDSTAFYLVKAALPFSKIEVLQLQKTISSQNSTDEQAHAEMASLLGKLEGMVRAGADSLFTAHKTKEALSVLKLYSTENLDAIYAETAVSYAEKSEAQTALEKLKTYPTQHANHHLAMVLEIILAQKTASNSRNSVDKAKLYQLYTNGDAAGFKAAALLANYDDTLLAPYLPEEERKKEVVNAATSLWDKVPFVEKASLTVYPKPANSSVTILCTIPKSTAITIEITDAKGALVYKENTEGETVNLLVETSKWQSGVYFIKAFSNDFSIVKSDKFVITH